MHLVNVGLIQSALTCPPRSPRRRGPLGLWAWLCPLAPEPREGAAHSVPGWDRKGRPKMDEVAKLRVVRVALVRESTVRVRSRGRTMS
jgi:hypothetical protein